MKLGAEPRKVAILGVLVAVGGYLAYTNFFPGDGAPTPPTRPAVPAATQPAQPPPPATVRPPEPQLARRSTRGGMGEFRPSLKPKRPEDRVDPMTVDPSLRLELLARLQTVKAQGGERSLFEFSQPKPPKREEPKILPKPVARVFGPQPPPPPTPPPPPAPKPPPTPIPLKFYGFINSGARGPKRAFFLDGEEIHVAGEGETVKNRYKVVRIGVNSVVMEDVQQKSEQSLPLAEEQKT